MAKGMFGAWTHWITLVSFDDGSVMLFYAAPTHGLGSSYFPCGKRVSKNSDADMPEFLIASLRVVVRQASRDLRHSLVALLEDHLMQRSCARSHCGMKTPSTSARAGGKKAIKGRRRINRIRHHNMHEW